MEKNHLTTHKLVRLIKSKQSLSCWPSVALTPEEKRLYLFCIFGQTEQMFKILMSRYEMLLSVVVI